LMNSGDDQVTNTNELPMMLTSDMFPQAWDGCADLVHS
jgi:hypothetical protein